MSYQPRSTNPAFVRPPSSGWAWINQGTASVTTQSNGGIYLLTPADTTTNLRLRERTAPATPWTVTAHLTPTVLEKSFHSYGLFFREDGTGEIHVFDVVGVGTAVGTSTYTVLRSAKFTSATAFSAEYTSVTTTVPLRWMRISDDGANRICSYSADGVNWIAFHSIGRTDFLTADRLGFYAAGENAATPNLAVGVLLDHWVTS